MFSLILPYWDRQEAADKALNLLAKTYSGTAIEVIVVDDGNKVPFRVPDVDLNIKVVRLPEKDKPTPQSKAWNAGVDAASNDVVVLSCVEVLHREPILNAMFWELGKQGKDGYVLAAAYCPEEHKWHCHSTEKIPFCPEGTGPAFCGMLYKELFLRAGGFDESYHDGAGYEDKDFIHRLLSVGAKFVIRDDLIVIHPKTGAKIKWPADGFARNADLFFDKWCNPVNIICLKAGTAYGPEYVNILADMIARNLRSDVVVRMWCITDDPTGLDPNIRIIPLPDDLETWWGKLYMFKRGLLPDGSRCLFMDLDTLIVGPLDNIIQYRGQFATLRDFYYPQQLGPAIIAWEAGDFAASIWEEWVAQGKPRHAMGDLWWLNNLDQGRFAKSIDILQDVFPGKFVSYKVSCNPYPPKGTSVVCFHGQPKPGNCGQSWVEGIWKIGGNTSAELEVCANTAYEAVKSNVLSACNRDLPWLDLRPAHDKHAVIVGGGPSIEQTMPEVKWRHSLGHTIIAINGSAEYLNKHGIRPDIQVIIDARESNSRFVNEWWSKERFLASQCHPSVFDKSGRNTTIFHMNTEGISDILPDDRIAHLISSGTTVGLAAMAIAYTQGYRFIHLHGFDSSYVDSHHAYPQPENDGDVTVNVSVEGRNFKCAAWMATQAQQFQELALQLAEEGVIITVAGDGLIPYIARCMSKGG